MNAFVRTRSGIRNYHFFLGGTITAFCEGGARNISVDEISSGITNSSAEDVTFWRAMAEAFIPGTQINFKPIGNKIAVENVAKFLIERGDKRVIFFLDRDWDDICGKQISHNKVVYTRGYCWENDAVSPVTVAKAVMSIGHLADDLSVELEAEVEKVLKDLQRALFWPLRLQLSSIDCGASFVPTNEGCGGAVVLSENDQNVSINVAVLCSIVRRYKPQYVRKREISRDECLDTGRVPGHVLMGLSIKLIKSFLKRVGSSRRPGGEAIKDMILEKFKSSLSAGELNHLSDYYADKMNNALR